MEDAKGTIRTVDAESGLLCDESREAVEQRLGARLPPRLRFDWDATLEP